VFSVEVTIKAITRPQYQSGNRLIDWAWFYICTNTI